MRTLDFVVKELSRRKVKFMASILSVILGICSFVATQRQGCVEKLAPLLMDKPVGNRHRPYKWVRTAREKPFN